MTTSVAICRPGTKWSGAAVRAEAARGQCDYLRATACCGLVLLGLPCRRCVIRVKGVDAKQPSSIAPYLYWYRWAGIDVTGVVRSERGAGISTPSGIALRSH